MTLASAADQAPADMATRRPPLMLSLQFAGDFTAVREAMRRHRVARWIRAALDAPGEITVRVVGAEEGRALNRDYRGTDHPTNVLTFDYSRAPRVAADLVLCAPVLEREAAEAKVSLEAHCAHLLVHGTLHAQGHDHEDVAEAEAMEARESVLMLRLGPWRVLWCSDAGWNAEKFLCAKRHRLRCDVLIRSQHEQDVTMTNEFLLKAGPRAILCGSDARDAKVMLPESLIEYAKQRNIPLLDTWSDGSIELQFNRDDLHILPARNGRRVVLQPRE